MPVSCNGSQLWHGVVCINQHTLELWRRTRCKYRARGYACNSIRRHVPCILCGDRAFRLKCMEMCVLLDDICTHLSCIKSAACPCAYSRPLNQAQAHHQTQMLCKLTLTQRCLPMHRVLHRTKPEITVRTSRRSRWDSPRMHDVLKLRRRTTGIERSVQKMAHSP